MPYKFRFITASHNEKTLQQNLLRSYMVKKYDLLVQRNFKNIAEAYNNIDNTPFDIHIFVHHDVFLPHNFEEQLIDSLDRLPPTWKIAGPAGVKLIDGKKNNYGHIMDRGKIWGSRLPSPVKVQTLDELMLVIKGPVTFDEKFAQDFYGADACIQAATEGNECFAINAFCEHNSSREFGGRTPEFYQAEKDFRFKWFRSLPIVTTCSLLT